MQLCPPLLLPVLLLGFDKRYTRSGDLWAALAWYVAAKVLEALDRPIYALGEVISGHTLKHLAAAVSAYMILHMLQRRAVVQRPEEQAASDSC